MDRIKVLVVAPYASLLTIVECVAPDFPDLDVTVSVGDLEGGLAAAHTAFAQNYDVVVSRGGTAQILEEELSVPVVGIELSTGDIVRQVRRISVSGERLAAVGFGNTFSKLPGVADIIGTPVDVETVDFADEVPLALDRLVASGHQTFLCDNLAFRTARDRGLDAHLLLSGPESVWIALDRARFYVTQWREGTQRNRLLWNLIQSQPGHLVLYSEAGQLIYSDLSDDKTWLLEEIDRRLDDETERFVLRRHHRIWRVRRSAFESSGRSYVVFNATSSREPVQGGMAGIEYLSRREVEEELHRSIFYATGGPGLVKDAVATAVASGRPVMLRGEVGSGKDQIVKLLYLASSRTQHPYVSIDCSLLSERGLEFLTESHASPLYETGQTVCLRALHALVPEAWHELLAVARQTGLAKRNLVLLSGNDNADGTEPEVLTAFCEQLRCHQLTVAPLRTRPGGVGAAALRYLDFVAAGSGIEAPQMDTGALALLEGFAWPRNYLQLRKVLDWLVATAADGGIGAPNVRAALEREEAMRFSSTATPSDSTTLDLLRPLADIERDVAQLVLASCQGNRTRAAEILGISRTTLWRLLK